VNHMCWTTGGDVYRVGLQGEKFVEAGPQANRFVEASHILSPWSTNCVTCRLKNLGVIRSWPRIN